MSLLGLIAEILLALARLLAPASAGERATGAALQRAEDMSHEQARITAAARAGLAAERLPAGPDPFDRDSAP